MCAGKKKALRGTAPAELAYLLPSFPAGQYDQRRGSAISGRFDSATEPPEGTPVLFVPGVLAEPISISPQRMQNSERLSKVQCVF
jgi:hypothetical protein